MSGSKGLWREAATLIVVARNKLLSSAGGSFDYRVLMLKRSEKSRFMVGILFWRCKALRSAG